MAEANMGTLYDINKVAYAKLDSMPEDKAKEMFTNIGMWFSSKKSFKYFMFLCKELSDYTVFNFESFNYSKGKDELVDLVDSRGTLLDIVYNHNADGYEIWVRSLQDGEIHMYMLFDCNDFIITV